MPTRQPHETIERHAALSSACRIALRILVNGGRISEALQFLAAAGARYLGAPIAIVVDSERAGSWRVVAPAAARDELDRESDQPAPHPTSVAGATEYLSTPIYSGAGEAIGEIRLYTRRLDDAPAGDFLRLRALADTVTRIVN